MRAIVGALALLASAATPATAEMTCRAGAKPMARVELFFGAAAVSKAAWVEFLAREITPRFPDGLTVFDARGQWRGPSGRIGREASRVLLVWYAPAADADARIEAIRTAYMRRFHQRSVLRVDGEDCLSF